MSLGSFHVRALDRVAVKFRGAKDDQQWLLVSLQHCDEAVSFLHTLLEVSHNVEISA